MVPLVGYADRLSARGGETLRFHVANATGRPIETPRIVRVISADPNPAGGGIRLEPIHADVRAIASCGPQPTVRGSYGKAPLPVAARALSAFTVMATIKPTRIAAKSRPVMTSFAPARASGIGLAVSGTGSAEITIATARGPVTVETGVPMPDGDWARIWASYDPATATVEIGQQALRRGRPASEPVVVRRRVDGAAIAPGPHMLIAAAEAGIDGATFNGRIERPSLLSRALPADETDAAATAPPGSDVVACWDFGREIGGNRIVDIGPHGCHGELVGMPTRAVTGARWSGREMSWRHAPEEYAAIHFHDDDIVDFGWPATHEWAVPMDLRSGSYALLAKAGEHEENIPFFIVPRAGSPRARIAVLMSTFTYVVYQNNARIDWVDPAWREAWHGLTRTWGGYPNNPGDHPEYGWSTYNYHSDRTGICFASWQRPMLNVRIGYLTYAHPHLRGSGLRHYPADHHLLSWLEAKGYDFDVITDWELHTEGHALLRHYPVLLTGSHPEYHTTEMLDALERYRDGGGRLGYLGGNGFYWKIALSRDHPGLIEIRRAEGGIRAWASDVGEYYNQLDGGYGGLWRRNGRPPQNLVGVGFTAQGGFVGSHYRVLGEARGDPRVAWIFNGIGEETIGGFGLSGHGAAGFELDRTDKRLGTPQHAIVLARSEGHEPETPWVLVPEELLTHTQTTAGQPARELIHADMTFFETAGGTGAVFSTGSITFCGALPVNRYDNNISRLLGNVLDRFLDPSPFGVGVK
jgi:N,N-dimethylformamidase